MPYIIESPFPSFNDTDGSPLNNGYVYVGSANLNPVTDPIPVYWDEALTQPAAQPIRTINGYLSRNGSPGRIYTNFITYSFRVTNNKGEQVFSDLNYTDPTSSAGSTYQQVITAIAGQTVFNLSRTYVPGTNNLFVYRNGLRLIVGQDYNETGYSQVTLTAGADNGDEFVFDIGYNYDSAASVDAQDVTYKLPAIDSVFTNVEAKLAETVSVKDFGAVGDGTTDDTAAIQAAIDYVDSIGGGTVHIPSTSSFYNLSAALQVGSNTTLLGDGMSASKLKWTSLPPTSAPLDITGGRRAIVNKNLSLSGTQNSNISIENLKVDLSLLVGALANSRQAVFFFNCSFTSVRNCHIISDGGCVLNVKVTNYIVDSNHIEQAGTYYSSDGLIDQWWGSNNGIVSKNYINGKLLCHAGILITGSDTVGGAGGTMSNIVFSENIIENSGKHAIWIEGRIDTVERISIVNNTIDVCGDGTASGFGYGIRVLSCNDVVISENQIANCQIEGIQFSAQQGETWTRNGSNYVVSNNIIKNVGLLRNSGLLTTSDAISCFYTNKVQITNNQITPLSTALYEYAIQIDAIATDCVISENIFVPGYYADCINFGAQTANIFRNVGFKTEALGQATIPSGSSIVTVTGLGLNFNPSIAGSPHFVSITPLSSPTNMALLGTPVVTNLTQTQFQVFVAANVAQNFTFKWSIVRL